MKMVHIDTRTTSNELQPELIPVSADAIKLHHDQRHGHSVVNRSERSPW